MDGSLIKAAPPPGGITARQLTLLAQIRIDG
jgi:hypothetical protein